MTKLIVEPLKRLSFLRRIQNKFGLKPYPRIIAIDGLDECSSQSVQSNIIQIIGDAVRDLRIPVRFLVASRPEPEQRLLVGAFIFSRTAAQSSDGNLLIPTIASQLVRAFPEIKGYVDKAIREDPQLLDKAPDIQMTKLIVEPLKRLSFLRRIQNKFGLKPYPRIIAIDGLDECSSQSVQSNIIQIIGDAVRDLRIPVRFLVASRPEPEQRLLVGAFIFSRTAAQSSDGNLPIPTIASQLVRAFPEIKGYVDKAIREDPQLLDKAPDIQMTKLIVEPLKRLSFLRRIQNKFGLKPYPRIIAIDGLDECSSQSVQSNIIQIIGDAVRDLRIPVRFLVASRPEPEQRLLVGAFIFSRTAAQSSDGNLLIPTIASQLVRAFPEIKGYVDKAIREDPQLLDKAPDIQMTKLIVEPLKRLSFLRRIQNKFGLKPYPRIIAIDGLDECSSQSVQSNIIQIIGDAVRDLRIPVRFLVASRPEPEQRLLVGAFIFSRTAAQSSDGNLLIPTIASQLVRAFPEIKGYVDKAIREDPQLLDKLQIYK